jgi:uncharacterized protein YggE
MGAKKCAIFQKEAFMWKMSVGFLSLALLAGLPAAKAQTVTAGAGTLVVVPGFGEVKHPNDEARATFIVEEQDKDKAQAASRANLKMKQGMELLKREDPQASLKTRGYYTYPVYAEEQQRQPGKVRQPTSWRVGQYLELTTTSLDSLPKTVAAAQRILALNGLSFGLSDASRKKLDERAIEASYRNLSERVGAVARVMGKNPSDAVMDTVDFEGSGNYAQTEATAPKMMRSAMADAVQVEEPSFEPGESTVGMRVVGKVRFK